MILHTTEVTPLPGYRLFLRFNNGEAGEVDLSAEIDGEVFEALHDPAARDGADARVTEAQAAIDAGLEAVTAIDEDRVRQIGISRFLTKPVPAKVLADIVNEYLSVS